MGEEQPFAKVIANVHQLVNQVRYSQRRPPIVFRDRLLTNFQTITESLLMNENGEVTQQFPNLGKCECSPECTAIPQAGRQFAWGHKPQKPNDGKVKARGKVGRGKGNKTAKAPTVSALEQVRQKRLALQAQIRQLEARLMVYQEIEEILTKG